MGNIIFFYTKKNRKSYEETNRRVSWETEHSLLNHFTEMLRKKSRWREEHFYLLHRMEYDVAGL